MRKTALVVMIVAVLAAAGAWAAEEEAPRDPEARKTWIAERREEAIRRREEFLKLPPEEQERIRAERREKRKARDGARGEGDDRARAMNIRGPLPLPVRIDGGAPIGEACPGADRCSLRYTPPAGQAAVITSVWSATKLECDGVSSSTPRDGSPVEPWWRCEQRITIEGPGAGYLGFLTSK